MPDAKDASRQRGAVAEREPPGDDTVRVVVKALVKADRAVADCNVLRVGVDAAAQAHASCSRFPLVVLGPLPLPTAQPSQTRFVPVVPAGPWIDASAAHLEATVVPACPGTIAEAAASNCAATLVPRRSRRSSSTDRRVSSGVTAIPHGVSGGRGDKDDYSAKGRKASEQRETL